MSEDDVAARVAGSMAEFTPHHMQTDPPPATPAVLPASPAGNPYRITVAEAEDTQTTTPEPDSPKPRPTPLISKELSMVTRELSTIARQGTNVSLLGRERSMTSSPTSRTRTGLVSRISILPAAFLSPPPEMDIDHVSGASLLHLSFLYTHAPSIQNFVKELSTELVDLDDDDLQNDIEESVKKQQYLFPKSCFEDMPGSGSVQEGVEEDSVEGVAVEVATLEDCETVNRSQQTNGSVPTGATRTRKISTGTKGTEGSESLPMVTPRAVLLTPEPTDSDKDSNHEEDAALDTKQSKTNPVPRKNQIMVCLKPVKNQKKIHKGRQDKGKLGDCQFALVEDVFREVLDQRGFDFLCLDDKVADGQLFLTPLDQDEDICVMMECTKWPLVAQRWFRRDRHHWPSEEVISELKTVPCHVTPFPIKDKDNLKFLKTSLYSYPLVDNILFGSLTHKQCTVFAIVSILYHKHFSTPPLLQLAHIKSLFFWACELTPADFWNDYHIASCVFYILNQLTEALAHKRLPHYITEGNMLQHACRDTAKEVADMVRLVRKTPIESLVNSNHFTTHDEGLCEPILNYMMGDPQTWDRISSIVLTAIKIGQSYVPEHGKDKSAAILNDVCQIVFQFRHFDEPSIAVVQVTCDLYSDLCDLDKVIEYMENMAYIAYEYENDHLDLSYCLSRLATLYHCKSLEAATDTNPDTFSTSIWLQKAQEYFDLALLEDYTLVSVLHFAIFLMNQKRPLEALEKLTNAIALTDETDESQLLADTMTFTPLEVLTLDDDLAMEVKVMGTAKAPTVVMGYYHLCRALLAAGISRGLEEYTLILEILAGCEANLQQATTWALLGYIQHARGDVDSAKTAFRTALELRKDYDVVKEKMWGYSRSGGCGGSSCCTVL